MSKKVELNHETASIGKVILPAVYYSIDEAVENLGLSKRVKWKNYLGYLCRYTKKSICPEFVVENGFPVQLNGR